MTSDIMTSDIMTSDSIKKVQRSCIFLDLKTLEYKRALDLQLAFLNAKINNPLEPDRLLFLEHPRVYTLGRRGGLENLTVSEEFLSSQGIKIIQTDRGGNITFHGPGQAVLYPIIDLTQAKIGVADFVNGMEEVMKQTVHEFGIPADRNKKNHGIWVGNKKIGSLGISIKKGISIHGLALNVCIDLTPFSWINPCGLENITMTSIALEIAKSNQSELKGSKFKSSESKRSESKRSGLFPDYKDKQGFMDKVCKSLVHRFANIFDFKIIRSDYEQSC
jgi:lipoyl(octanoyl) transferase